MKIAFKISYFLLITTIAYFCAEIVYKTMIPDNFVLPDARSLDIGSKNTPQSTTRQGQKNMQTYDNIIKRNLFMVQTDEPTESSDQNQEIIQPEKLEVTSLKLELWGTVTGGGSVFAVIEDKALREQSLYQEGDSIQGAMIKKILRNQVILNYQGKDQVLEMEDQEIPVSRLAFVEKADDSEQATKDEQTDKIEPESDSNELQDNLDISMNQVKFRPHFSDGQQDGLMIYGIRPNSVFIKIGLRNGDIIKAIDGTPVTSPEDALQTFSVLEQNDTAMITLFRRGEEKELLWQSGDVDVLEPKGEE